MSAHTGGAQCPYCSRHVRTDHSRYVVHSITPKQMDRCPLSDQRVPVTGHSERDHERRAYTVMDLAEQIQNSDPELVWTYLTALPADELQRLLVIALAGVPVPEAATPEDVFAWVLDLPIARTTPAQEISA